MSAPLAGSIKAVTSFSNPLVKDLRALHLKKYRDASGLFLAEGLQLVRFALEAGWQVKTLLFSDGRLDEPAFAQAALKVRAGGGTLVKVPPAVLAKIAQRDNPQTVLAALAQRFSRLAEVGGEATRQLPWIALDRVRDPGNLGTILRTADAAGAAGVVLVGESCDPYSPEAVRATMGSIFNTPVVRCGEAEFIAHVSEQKGLRLTGTHLGAEKSFREADYAAPCVVLMGNEQKGLSQRLAGACDELVHIPMAGRAESLNLAVATGLVIYEARRMVLA